MQMLLASERHTGRRAVIVECEVVREEGFRLMGRSAMDLSTDGMLLRSNVPARPGDELIVTFRVPGTDRWIDTIATVARIVQGRRQGDRGRALGLRFAPLDPESNRLLRWTLRSTPPTLPVRPQRVDYAATASMIALS